MANFTLTTSDDSLSGGAGDDVFTVPSNYANIAATDTISGGAGTDTLSFSRSGDVSIAYSRLTGLSSIEVLEFSAASSLVLSVSEALVQQSGATSAMTGGPMLSVVSAGATINLDLRQTSATSSSIVQVVGGGSVTLFNAAQQRLLTDDTVATSVIGGTGSDWITSGAASDSINGGDGNDSLVGNGGNDTLIGGGGQDRIRGVSGNNLLSGGDGYDLISGGSGSDTMTGGADSDAFVILSGDVTITDFDITDAYERIDLRALSGITGFTDLTLDQIGADTRVTADSVVVTLENITASAVTAEMFVFAGDTVVTRAEGLSAAAAFTFSAEADVFVGGSDAEIFDVLGNFANLSETDSFSGGAGLDVLRIWGADRSIAPARLGGMSGIDILDLTGTSGTTVMTVDSGMVTQSDSDALTIRHGPSAMTLDVSGASGAGSVTIEGTGVVTLYDADGQTVRISDSIAGNVIGGNRNDVMIGGRLADSLSGGEGNDSLEGGNGDDTLIGGAGHDTLVGGDGTVILTGGADIDRFVVTAGSSTTITDFAGRAAFERIDLRDFAGLSFASLALTSQSGGTLVTLPDGITTIFLSGVAVASLAAGDFIFPGETVAQLFTLTTGADSFTGGAADDVFDVIGNIAALDAAMDRIDGGYGLDTLRIYGDSRSLGTARLDAMSSIEIIDLTNTSGSNLLTVTEAYVASSNSGTILVRHGSAALLLDTATVTDAAHVIIEGSGTVTLRDVPGQMVTISDNLAGHVIAGNDASVIVGGLLGDIIEGGELQDTLSGGGGNDTISGGDSDDVISGGSGHDLMDGGAGDDRLTHSGGSDTMTGGAGDDHFVLGSGGAVTITDFEANNRLERIDLSGISGLAYSDLTIAASGADLRVTATGVDLTLTGVGIGDIDATDFLFEGQDPLVFNVDTSISMADLQHLLNEAPAGAEIHFAAGTYEVTQTLVISRSDISLIGAGEGETIFLTMIPDTSVGPTIQVQYDAYPLRYGAIAADAVEGSREVTLADGHDVQVGDLLYIGQPNDETWLTATGNAGWAPPEGTDPDSEEYWLREVRSEVVAVNGNVITLREEMPYTFEAGKAEAQKSIFLENVNLSGFTIQGRWGEPDANDFTVTNEAWEGQSTLELDGLRDSTISDISILASASHAFRLQRLYDVTGDSLTTNGAHNKDGGNGYGYLVYETFATEFTNLTSIDNRHALLFSSYSAEHYNTFELAYINRDINFHGSPDADNTIVVDKMRQQYPAGSAPQFDAVQSGSFPLHPYSAIEDNDVTFKDAVTAERDDIVHAYSGGGRLSTGIGNDRLIGGAGNDTLDGGENGDILTGGGGQDRFLRQNADFTDTITDFATGDGGDIMVLIGSAYRKFSELQFVQDGADVLLQFGTTKGFTRFQNHVISDFSAANFLFQNDSVAGETFVLKATDMLVVGSDKHDRFEVTSYQTESSSFVAIGGAGLDTLDINQRTLTATLHQLGTLSGIEVYDVADVRTARISVSNVTAALSDTQRLTLVVGDDTTASAVALEVDPLGKGRTISVDGSRAVVLADGQSNTVKSTDRIGTNITGGDQSDIIYGGRAGDSLTGAAGNDTILALAGDDWIDGGIGADIMNGGPGSDTYIVDNLGDRIAESRRWDGTDLVISSVDFKMGTDHIENLTLVGNAHIRGIGNGLENRIIGNSGNNIIDGGPRVDYMAGGAGNDSYYVRDSGDIVVELANEGNDTIFSFLSRSLVENVENLRLIGTATINGFGNSANNTVYGNAANNTLDGLEGNDTLWGGAGADTFRFISAPSSSNADVILDFVSGTDKVALVGSAFGGHARGALDPSEFFIGTVAQDADDRVIFDATTHALYFDADGTGAAEQQLVATLNDAMIVYSDIVFL